LDGSEDKRVVNGGLIPLNSGEESEGCEGRVQRRFEGEIRRVDNGYGYPGFWGPRRFRWAWGWPNDFDVWKIPYTDSTLIVDIIDGQTNQLIWRGYDVNTIDMTKPDKRLDKAVDGLVKKFIKDTNARS